MKKVLLLTLWGSMALEAAELTETRISQEECVTQLQDLQEALTALYHSTDQANLWKETGKHTETFQKLAATSNFSDPKLRSLSENIDGLICQLNIKNYDRLIETIDGLIESAVSYPQNLNTWRMTHGYLFTLFQDIIFERDDIPDHIKKRIETRLRSLRATFPHNQARSFLDSSLPSSEPAEHAIQKLLASKIFKVESYESGMECIEAINALTYNYDLDARQQAVVLESYISRLTMMVDELEKHVTSSRASRQMDSLHHLCSTLGSQVNHEKIRPLFEKLTQIREILTSR